MQPRAVCLRCQVKLHKRLPFAKGKDRRYFASLAPDIEPQHNKDGSVTDGNKGQKWSTRTARRGDGITTNDAMVTMLKELFDAKRHKKPTSENLRYSRRPFESAIGSQKKELKSETPQLEPRSTDTTAFGDGIPSSSTLLGGNLEQGADSRTFMASSKYTRSARPSITNTRSGKSTQSEPHSVSMANAEESISQLQEGNILSRTQESNYPHSEQRKYQIPGRQDQFFDRSTIKDGKSTSKAVAGRNVTSPRKTRLFQRNKSTDSPSPQPSKSSSPSSQYQMARANHRKTTDSWQRFKTELVSGKHTAGALSATFNRFLWIFAELRNTELVNDVWETMLQYGVRPTADHWNAFLKVSSKTRDYATVRNLWAKMIDYGTAPDNQGWTIYIGACLQAGDWREALQIIEDMGKAWKAELAKDSNTVVDHTRSQCLPSIVPINAAITGLLNLNREDVAKDILEWAQAFSIKSETMTYNILLRHACNRSNHARIDSLIDEMHKKHIKQDVITKTILLDCKLRNPSSLWFDLEPAAQEELVLQEMKQMLSGDEKPNANTFAVVLHSLLGASKPNLPAARAVYRLLLQQDFEVAPQLYTILFTHYFRMENLDLAAIDSLWEQLEREKAKTDHVLFDRMIEGYASLGQIEKMLTFFSKMNKAGQIPGWLALSQGLTALASAQRWDLCADFVADVVNDRGRLHLGKRGLKGEKQFWQLVDELREQKLIPPS